MPCGFSFVPFFSLSFPFIFEKAARLTSVMISFKLVDTPGQFTAFRILMY